MDLNTIILICRPSVLCFFELAFGVTVRAWNIPGWRTSGVAGYADAGCHHRTEEMIHQNKPWVKPGRIMRNLVRIKSECLRSVRILTDESNARWGAIVRWLTSAMRPWNAWSASPRITTCGGSHRVWRQMKRCPACVKVESRKLTKKLAQTALNFPQISILRKADPGISWIFLVVTMAQVLPWIHRASDQLGRL